MLDRTAMTTLDQRPAFPDILTVGVARGWKHALRDRAEIEGISVSELVRRAIARLTRPGRRRRTVKARVS